MMDAGRVESFDLPDDLDADRVAIYTNPDPDEPHFRALPFEHVGTRENGTDRYQEIAPHEVTPEYRRAVEKRTVLDIEDIKLETPPVAPDHLNKPL